MNKSRIVRILIIGFSFLSGLVSVAQQAKRPFTVADEIGLTLFGDPNGGGPEVEFSHDGNYFGVWTERGYLDLNRVEDSLRFYRTQDVKDFLERSDKVQPPSPVWVVNRYGKEGPVIHKWRWLGDSCGVAFLEPTTGGNQRLVLADLRKKTIKFLTSETEAVQAFDIRDRQHYVYTVADTAEREIRKAERQAPAILGTGRRLFELLFPGDQRVSSRHSRLWAVVDGKRLEIKHNRAPIAFFGLYGESLALAPNGRGVVMKLPVPEVPLSWETLYPPPFASDPYRIRAGLQDPQSEEPVLQYVLIDLQTGAVQALTDAPSSGGADWWTGADSNWSSDGKAILLPDTFLNSGDHAASRPCIAVVDLPTRTRTCIETLKGRTVTGVEEGYHFVEDTRFVGEDKQRVMVTFRNHPDWSSFGTTQYRRSDAGAWQIVEQRQGEPTAEHEGVRVTVDQRFDKPPRLVAANKQTSRVIWNPNPQLRDIELGQASIYKWKDREGREWRAGLFKPGNYKAGQRYPLVIQTHGFAELEFRPSGAFPTAFAARALAATGIVVLQLQDPCPSETLEEGPCAASGYETIANRLVSEGLVDPEKIGIIGFSRTCFYVMETLTFGSLRLKAASITDGVMLTYSQNVMRREDLGPEDNLMIGAAPFGEGLQQWLKRSPGFNLDKINTPLMVVGEGPPSLLSMWEPYAGLRYLQKPVDLIMLNTREHVLTNPAVRMVSQGGTVDWFRFWLLSYEDPDPAKAEQYVRWRELRKLQERNESR